MLHIININDLGNRIARASFSKGRASTCPRPHRPGPARRPLVGRNSSGKTTLFRLIRGEISPSSDSLTLRPRIKLGCVSQDMPSGETNLARLGA